MPLVTESYDSLPYIDREPTAAQREAAQALINAEISLLHSSLPDTHSSLPPPPESKLSDLLASELARVEAKIPLSGIDLSRYEALEPPITSPHSDEKSPETLQLWREALQKAYTSHVYLSGRTKNLTALSETGKEEWLAGNEALVEILKDLEEELAGKKHEIDLVAVARQNAQQAVAGELSLLEDGWKKGVGKILETEVAAEGLRAQILEKRRAGAL
ncbi:MAG: hypothetical protein M1818_008128 [Claussenomyces sp. TS43310]|nr:MAG: hypothetical protein M1818_008128 [Claussenomyces sp. TS43310]